MYVLLLGCSPEPEASRLVPGQAVTCENPEARSSEGAFERAELGADWALQTPVGWEGSYVFGESLAIADLDGDGGLDLLVGDKSALVYYASDGDSWREVSASRISSEEMLAGISVVSPVDADGDGDLDLVVGRSWALNLYLENQGDGTFVQRTEDRGFPSDILRVRAASFGDMDADGDLDLFLAHDRFENLPPDPGLPNYLLENQGDATFVDVSSRLTDADRNGYTKVGAWFDADGDGTQDLYIVNHLPEMYGNQMRFNRGDGTFESRSEAGLDLSMSGMGFSLGDLNADGWPDMTVSGVSEVVMLESQEGVWAETDVARGLVPDDSRVFAWGNALSDLNNDTLLDVFTAFGEAEEGDANGPNPPNQPDALWLQQADGSFVEVAEAWGVNDQGIGRAVASVDIDGDGWLDLFTHGHNEPPVFYRARCGEESWLEVRLKGRAPNTHGIGARVRVEGAGPDQARWIEAGGALYTSLPSLAHFGLRSAEVVNVEVRWPDGSVDRFEGVSARQVATITQEGA